MTTPVQGAAKVLEQFLKLLTDYTGDKKGGCKLGCPNRELLGFWATLPFEIKT